MGILVSGAVTSRTDTGRDHEGVSMRTTSDSNWARRTTWSIREDDSNWARDAHWRDAHWR